MGGLVGQIGNLIGGQQGGGFQAQAAGIQNPFLTTQGQAATGQVNSALGNQNQLATSLQQANGVGNQSQVFGQQEQLAQALQQQAAGGGPNPAQAQLAQNTAANTANQAALMAGQRGASQNVGLIARQAAQTGAANQQAAVGQAATLQAQQQLAAQQNLIQQQANLAGTAGNQVNELGGANNAVANTALTNQGQVLGAYQGINQSNVANAGQQNQANAGVAQANANAGNSLIGGGLNAAGAALPGLGSAAAGLFSSGPNNTSQYGPNGEDAMDYLAEGGKVENPKLAPVPQKDRFPVGLLPSHLKDVALMYHSHHYCEGGMASYSKGGKVDAMVSPGEAVVPPGGDLKDAKKVPGKAKVRGDSTTNDTVPEKLAVGSVVIPRSIMMGEDAPEKARQFVADALHKHYSENSHQDDFKKALKAAIANRRDK